MNDPPVLTFEALKQKGADSLFRAEQAIQRHPRLYGEIKSLLQDILARTIDISEYYKTARKLAGLLEKLAGSSGETFFHYFWQNLDPIQQGDARYFRSTCRDLSNQIHLLDNRRAERRNLRIVK